MTTGATIHTTAGLHMRMYDRNAPPSQGMVHADVGQAHGAQGSGGCPMGFGNLAAVVAPAAATP